MTTKIYGYLHDGNEAAAISENGKWICGHIVSNEVEAMNLLGVKLTAYNQMFGEAAWTYEYIPRGLVASHQGLQKALSLFRTQLEAKI